MSYIYYIYVSYILLPIGMNIALNNFVEKMALEKTVDKRFNTSYNTASLVIKGFPRQLSSVIEAMKYCLSNQNHIYYDYCKHLFSTYRILSSFSSSFSNTHIAFIDFL